MPDPWGLIHDEEEENKANANDHSPPELKPPKPKIRHECISCLCGHRTDPPVDQWARRLVPTAYCMVTAMFFTIMATPEEDDSTDVVISAVIAGLIVYALTVVGMVCCIRTIERSAARGRRVVDRKSVV